ncbi:MAG: YchJ family protein [Kofleriaceae bacterium]
MPPTPTDDATCPCGTGLPFAACCQPILDGAAAATALALMRSRYAAFVRGRMDHVVGTHDPATRAALDVAGATRWSKETAWAGLEIVATEAGGATDDVGVVEFIARGATNGVPFAQRERSRFRRVDGRWHYVDGRLVPTRATPVASGRNAPCACGSGKKAKRCCGA